MRHLFVLLLFSMGACVTTPPKNNYSSLLEEMFQKVVVEKQADLQKKYYHPKFKLYANGTVQGYEQYVKLHEDIYKTAIEYKVDIQKNTIINGSNGTSMRVFITTSMPGEEQKEIEVILIATYKDGLIYRIWELTSPDWTKIDTFKKHLK